MSESRWLQFEKEPAEPDMKTDVYRVLSKTRLDLLGWVRWFPRWRQYAFQPVTGPAWFNRECLRDIASFLDGLMDERKMKRYCRDGKTKALEDERATDHPQRRGY